MPEPDPDTLEIRKRMKRREIPDELRFITFSCFQRLPLFSNEGIASLFLDLLLRAKRRDGIEVIAWVLMPEHAHLLLRPGPQVTLTRTLANLKIAHVRLVIARWRELCAPILERVTLNNGSHRLFQAGGGFDRNVRAEEELTKEIRYIHDNPVSRGLVARAEDWRWSSIRWWMGRRDAEFPCEYPRGLGWERWQGFVSRPKSDPPSSAQPH